MYMYKFLKIIKSYIPKTEHLIIIFSNVISFMTLQTCFFWFIASFKIEKIIDDKSKFIKDAIYLFPEIVVLLNNYTNYTNSVSFSNLEKIATEHKNNRYAHNINLLIEWMTPPFACMTVLLIGCIIECYAHKKKFDRTDKIILSMVLVSVFTEIIFYFVIIYRSEILADMEIVEIILNNIGINNLGVLTYEELFNMISMSLPNGV